MYIRRSTRSYKGRTYTNYVLVESVSTAKGPRQNTICSLGDLSPRPREEWLKLACKVEAALQPVTAPAWIVPLDEVDRRVADMVVRAALRGLGAREREAVYLRYYEDLSFAETARIMNAPQVTIRVIVHRALVKLRRQLEVNLSGDKVAIP